MSLRQRLQCWFVIPDTAALNVRLLDLAPMPRFYRPLMRCCSSGRGEAQALPFGLNVGLLDLVPMPFFACRKPAAQR
jgi:hypothetical protein